MQHASDMERDDHKARGERLREARKAANLSVDQVAERARRSASGIRAIENGQNGLRPDAAEVLAPILGVTSAWLLTGTSERHAPMVPIIGTVGADAEGTVIQTTGQASGDTVPPPPGGTKDSVALEVRGYSMRGVADDGSIIYFDNQEAQPTADMIGYPCVVETRDGRVLIKRLLLGSRKGVYNLESINGPTMEDVELVWAAEIKHVTMPREAQRIIRRAGMNQVA